MSSHSKASGSANTVAASSNETPCFSKFPDAFRESQVNTIYVYTINKTIRPRKNHALRILIGLSVRLWKLVIFDRLTSILAGSIKILARAAFTACANKAGTIRAIE